MARSKEDAGDSCVVIKLIADDNVKELRERTITLTESDDTIPIGRASKVATKGFVAATDNAWFDSPVMSRNHAEIVANFHNKTVTIADIGSLHGTFINGEKRQIKKNEPLEIRDGYQVTFGMPIWRNSESFAPATIKVGIVHKSGRVEGPSPGSTFALPEYVDDDSSDSGDEESVEADEELAVSHMQGQSKQPSVDLTERRRQVEMVDLTDKGMSSNVDSTADDLIDLTSPPRAISPDMVNEQENDENLRVLHATAMILDKIVDTRSDRDGSNMRSPFSQASDAEPESLSPSGPGSDSTESEMGMDDNGSDDDEGSSSDDQIADWDAEYSSDDDVLDEEDPDTAAWPPVEERPSGPDLAHHGPGDVSVNAMEGNDTTLSEAPPHTVQTDHPFSFAGPYPVPYYPLSETAPGIGSRMTLPSLIEVSARQASPSDAALPKRSVHLPTFVPMSSYGGATAEVLGEKTGKHEFFAARAENRRRVFAPSRQPTSPSMPEARTGCIRYTRPTVPEANQTVVENPSVVKETVAAEEPMDVANPAVEEQSAVVEKLAITEKPANIEEQAAFEKSVVDLCQPVNECEFRENLHSAEVHGKKPAEKAVEKPDVAEQTAAEEMQPSTEPAPAVIPKSFADRQTVDVTPLLRTGDSFLNCAQSSVDLQLPSLPGDDTDEPISAYELQKRKLAAQRKAEMPAATIEAEQSQSSRRTYVGISDLVDRSPVPTELREAEAAGTAKGKRKADEMGELTEHEIQWEAAESKLMGYLRTANETMLRHTPMDIDHPAVEFEALVENALRGRPEPQARSVNVFRHNEPMNDIRPPKRLRLRKIAERLGYAALGGATVGAALVSTLIYTAPTFT